MTAYFPSRLGKSYGDEFRSLKLGIQKTHLLVSSGDAYAEAGHKWQLFKRWHCKAVRGGKCPLLLWHSVSSRKQARERVKQRWLNSSRISFEVLTVSASLGGSSLACVGNAASAPAHPLLQAAQRQPPRN